MDATSVVLDGTELLKIVGATLVPMLLGFWHLSGRLSTIDTKVTFLQGRVDKTETAVFEPAWKHAEVAGVKK